jgi:hypothetical protein
MMRAWDWLAFDWTAAAAARTTDCFAKAAGGRARGGGVGMRAGGKVMVRKG